MKQTRVPKVLVISGASKGIGHATAALFLEKSYRVINVSRSPSALNGIINVSADLSDANGVPQTSDRLLAETAAAEVIVLIHNAAMMVKDNNETVKPEIMQRVFQLNVIAAMQLNQLLLPRMKPVLRFYMWLRHSRKKPCRAPAPMSRPNTRNSV